MSKRAVRVLIVDDSAVVRSLLSRLLSSDPGIEVVGTAPDPYIARDKLVALQPDVMTLDIEMPRMDGLTFLGKVMEHFPVRTVVISSLSTQASATALKALELGAVDVLAKPALDVTQSLTQMGAQLISRVKTAAQAKLPSQVMPKLAPRAAIARAPQGALDRTTHQIIAIASSTGGTEALKRVLPALPPDLPGTVIVQHMPPVFTRTYAQHLQEICPFEVKEAVHGDRVIPGRVLLAPGDHHMEIVRSGGYYSVVLHQQPHLHGVRPAADFLLKSVARDAGANAVGVVLTGMGKDGAEGLLAMRSAGALTIAQDEASCVVYGMPKVAFEIGAVERVLPLSDIASEILAHFKRRAA